MQEQINTRPLVDILSEQTKKIVVMSGEKYVYLDTKTEVEASEVETAIAKRDEELAAATKEATVKEFTGYVEEYIQKEVDDYNKANGLQFRDVHSCANYKDNTDYAHQGFCLSVWNWNVAVWETARMIQASVFAGTRGLPAKDEFLAELPVFTFGG